MKTNKSTKIWRENNREHIKQYGKQYRLKRKKRINKRCKICNKLLDYKNYNGLCFIHMERHKYTDAEKENFKLKSTEWHRKNKNTSKYKQRLKKIGESNKIALKGRKLLPEHKSNVLRALKINRENPKRIQNLPKGCKNNMWKGGVTPLNEKLRKCPQLKKWKKDVFERDNYICQNPNCSYCNNKKGVILNAHHIKPFSTHRELIFNVSNGITYCIDFHLKSGLHKNRGDNKCFY